VKIAIAGKGGVGKTFISGTLARILAQKGYNVLVVDADPNINTASAIGISTEEADKIIPLSDNEDLIKEKTGVSPGKSYGQIFRLTPSVNDIVENYGIEGPDGVKLLIMGTVKGGNTGCMCPSNALLRVLVQHMLIQRNEVLIMDMVAGLEHLGRGTARRMDAMLVVVEPRMKSIDTARRIKKLAVDIDVKEVLAVGNKISSSKEQEFLDIQLERLDIPIIAYLPYDDKVAEADMLGKAPMDYYSSMDAIKELRKMAKVLLDKYGQ